jgi:phosphatidylserine/phosphatidylglycerophosphate/cardiolipin synthase-like enzyme
MKRLSFLLFLFLANGCTSVIQPQSPPPAPVTGSLYFPPQGEETEVIVRELNKSQNSILVQSFSIFSDPVAKALVSAQERGVNVQILLDKSPPDELYIANGIFVNVGISIKIDSAHAIGQNKVMIIDGETIITGSFNFTKAAEDKNAVNLLVIRDKATAKKYTKSWQYHEGHSEPYSGRGR